MIRFFNGVVGGFGILPLRPLHLDFIVQNTIKKPVYIAKKWLFSERGYSEKVVDVTLYCFSEKVAFLEK